MPFLKTLVLFAHKRRTRGTGATESRRAFAFNWPLALNRRNEVQT
jgi:hypothetical protein